MAPPASAAPLASRSDYGRFGLGVASWFGAFGMQGVLYSWLVVGELRAEPEWVGVAQTAQHLPALALLLLGGATADRTDTQRLLVRLHLLAAVPVAGLALAVAGGFLSLPVMIGFALAMGSVMAFVMPARDTLLSRVAGDDMMRAVTGMTVVQFGAQALGTGLAGAARWVGSAPMLAVQAGLVLLGALATRRVGAAPPLPRDGARSSNWSDIREGLVEVARTPALRAPIALVASVGVLFIGPFLVVFPLLVRDHYQRDVAALSLVLMAFPVGTIAGSLLIRARGGIRRKGLACLVALAAGGSVLIAIGAGLPFPIMVAAVVVWGLAAAVFINSSRTLVQENAPQAHRARVLSVFQLGFLGAGPLGSLGSGFLAGRIGALPTLQLFGTTMLVFVALAWALSGTRRLE